MTSEQFNKRIVFQNLKTTIGDNGFETEEWIDYIFCWARVENLHVRENVESNYPPMTVKFTLRFIKSVENTMRIMFRDKQYKIIAINNIKYDNKYLEIRALEVEELG